MILTNFNSGCHLCLLQKIRPSLAANLRELEDKDEYQRGDIAIVVLGTSSPEEKERARTWMTSQYPGIQINMEEDLQGKEDKVVIFIGTTNLDRLTNLVSFLYQV